MDNKRWWMSKTILGAMSTFAVIVLGLLGYSVSAEDQKAIVDILVVAGGAVSTAVTIYGRIKASKGIGTNAKPADSFVDAPFSKLHDDKDAPTK